MVEFVEEMASVDSLSQEVLLQIFGYLDPPSLLSVAQVSRHWNRLSEDSIFWQRNLSLLRLHGNAFCSCAVHRSHGNPASVMKNRYFRKLMRDSIPRPVALDTSSSSGAKGRFFGKKSISPATLPAHVEAIPSSVCTRKNQPWGYFNQGNKPPAEIGSGPGAQGRAARIVLFGPGLDGAGSNLVYDLMWGQGSPFKTLGMFPNSHSGIGGGVKLLYQKAGIEVDLVTLYRATKKEREAFAAAIGPRTNRIIDSEFMLERSRVVSSSADAFIYVCDRAIVPEHEIQREFEVLVGSGAPEAPILLVMPDVVIEGGAGQTCSDYVDALGLAENPRRWWMTTLDLQGLEGLQQGLDWLLEPAEVPAGKDGESSGAGSFLSNLSKFSLSSLF